MCMLPYPKADLICSSIVTTAGPNAIPTFEILDYGQIESSREHDADVRQELFHDSPPRIRDEGSMEARGISGGGLPHALPRGWRRQRHRRLLRAKRRLRQTHAWRRYNMGTLQGEPGEWRGRKSVERGLYVSTEVFMYICGAWKCPDKRYQTGIVRSPDQGLSS
jgi:hypothetical protein